MASAPIPDTIDVRTASRVLALGYADGTVFALPFELPFEAFELRVAPWLAVVLRETTKNRNRAHSPTIGRRMGVQPTACRKSCAWSSSTCSRTSSRSS